MHSRCTLGGRGTLDKFFIEAWGVAKKKIGREIIPVCTVLQKDWKPLVQKACQEMRPFFSLEKGAANYNINVWHIGYDTSIWCCFAHIRYVYFLLYYVYTEGRGLIMIEEKVMFPWLTVVFFSYYNTRNVHGVHFRQKTVHKLDGYPTKDTFVLHQFFARAY